MYTDDSKNAEINLSISCNVEKVVTVSPDSVILNGSADQPLKNVVKIVAEEKYPFKIISARSDKGENIRFKLEEVKNSNNHEYLLTVENMRKEKGRYADAVYLETDSNVKKEIKIRVFGNIL